jgi:hypothetical protein
MITIVTIVTLSLLLALSIWLFCKYFIRSLRSQLLIDEMLGQWELGLIEEGNYVIDTLVHYNVHNGVINVFKERYRCMEHTLKNSSHLRDAETHVNANVE